MDYDQLCKSLLQTMFADFMRLFFPQVAEQLILDSPEWLPTEMFIAPPEGERRYPDLIAKVRLKNGKAAVIVIHLEIQERRDPFLGKRMHEYYTIIRIETGCEVFSVALQFHREPDAKAAVERAVYTESCLGEERLRFSYYRILVPLLWAEEYMATDSPLGWSLATRMKMRRGMTHKSLVLPIMRKASEHSLTNEELLVIWDFVRYSARLSFAEVIEVAQILEQENVARRGKRRKRQFFPWKDEVFMWGKREAILKVLETRFGPVPDSVKERVYDLVLGELDDALSVAATAESLEATDLLKPKRRSSRAKKNGKK